MSKPQRFLLLIDDNPIDRTIFKRYLQRDCEHDYVFTEAATGEQGIRQCHSASPDCILIDYNLPDMTGLELLVELTLKSDRSPYPIVMMTGEGDETVAAQAIQGGAQNYLVKGRLTPEALLIAVNNAIEKVKLRQEIETQQQHLLDQNRELQQRQEEIHALNVRLQRMMTESHHRIKNNLQILAALVNMFTMGNPETVPLPVLKRLETHIQTLAALHELLTTETKSDADFDTIDLKDSLAMLAPMIQVTAGERQVQITAQEIRVPLDKCSAFLLLSNELISNALKHGKGKVELSLSSDAKRIYLEVTDDGPGFPTGFDPGLAANTGLELVDSISRHDLRGKVVYENRPQGGASVLVTFPQSR